MKTLINAHYDSRKIQAGQRFICLPKGEKYCQDALDNGASDILHMSRKEMADFVAKELGHPSKKLKLIGVTGTNGKTTICHLVKEALEKSGEKPAVLGTLNAALTTPESLDIQCLIAEHLSTGGTHFIMEVSSHGIDQDRIAALDFDIKLLSNITQDHLDYHKTIAHYRSTKERFMREYPGKSIMPQHFEGQPLSFTPPLLGEFNYRNLQAAAAILSALDISKEKINAVLSQATAPPGRFEAIDQGQNFLVIVDYAHTHDSLENVLQTAQSLNQGGRIITVFGCGGDRDRDKRPKMGHVAAQYSQEIIITQDNPRTESMAQITADILEGLEHSTTPYTVIDDRKKAIQTAIDLARKNDIVLIAGKGHETSQVLADKTIDLDDRNIAREALKQKSIRPAGDSDSVLN